RVHQLDRLCPGSVAGRGLTHQRSRQSVQCPIPRGCVGFRPLSQPAAAGKDPTKDLTFKNNTLSVVTDGSAGAGGLSQGFNDMATTDFSGDNANAYNFGLATDATGLYTPISTEPTRSAPRSERLSGPPKAMRPLVMPPWVNRAA